jgi:hypothetical protein
LAVGALVEVLFAVFWSAIVEDALDLVLDLAIAAQRVVEAHAPYPVDINRFEDVRVLHLKDGGKETAKADLGLLGLHDAVEAAAPQALKLAKGGAEAVEKMNGGRIRGGGGEHGAS